MLEKLETTRSQKRSSADTHLILDDSSFYPPSPHFISRYLRTSATRPPPRHSQVRARRPLVPSVCSLPSEGRVRLQAQVGSGSVTLEPAGPLSRGHLLSQVGPLS